jgi:plastocyanin
MRDPACQNFPATTEDFRVSEGGLENVIVYVSSRVEGSFPPPASIVILDQRDCQFNPHVLTVQVGQRFVIQNNNNTAQNVHSWPTVNRPFNVSLAQREAKHETTFEKAEPPFPIRCDVHNWEIAYVGVFDHPFHTVSRGAGAYELRLPPGEYEITAWHERLGKAQKTVRVAATNNPPLNFVFKQP